VARLGADKVSTASQDLHAYRRDMWARELLAVAAAQPAGVLPAAVVWPSSTDELQAVVELALAHHVSLTPFGAGSGVTGGATPSAGSLVVDCKRLRSFSLDRDRMTVRCGAGWNGWHIEQAVNRHGLSIGHFPSSIMCSTVGGWVVTRGAGQMSTKYGKIEDMVAALQLVTGRGEKLELDCRRRTRLRRGEAWISWGPMAAERREELKDGNELLPAQETEPGVPYVRASTEGRTSPHREEQRRMVLFVGGLPDRGGADVVE
jgi:alkyldihydroxyacetonephosphate synthase